MTTEQTKIIESMKDQIEVLTHAVKCLCTQQGGRLTRQQMADRLGIHRNTLSNMLARDRSMPRPGKEGKWLLADVIDWELRKRRMA
ncbi:hypothetical protein GCM10027082_19480 [Comamonas humi]